MCRTFYMYPYNDSKWNFFKVVFYQQSGSRGMTRMRKIKQRRQSKRDVHKKVYIRIKFFFIFNIFQGWPQLLIFPEGTTTNGQALVRFRTGAFSTGHSIQPLCIRRLSGCCLVDTITWTWVKDHHVMALIIFTLMTPFTFLGL